MDASQIYEERDKVIAFFRNNFNAKMIYEDYPGGLTKCRWQQTWVLPTGRVVLVKIWDLDPPRWEAYPQLLVKDDFRLVEAINFLEEYESGLMGGPVKGYRKGEPITREKEQDDILQVLIPLLKFALETDKELNLQTTGRELSCNHVAVREAQAIIAKFAK